jgi:hypothetical protein
MLFSPFIKEMNLLLKFLTFFIDAMLRKLHEKKDVEPTFSMEEARQAIFTQDSGKSRSENSEYY